MNVVGMPMGHGGGGCLGGRRSGRTAEMGDRTIENSHILRKGGGTESSEGEGQRSGRSIKHEELKDRTKECGLWSSFRGGLGQTFCCQSLNSEDGEF